MSHQNDICLIKIGNIGIDAIDREKMSDSFAEHETLRNIFFR